VAELTRKIQGYGRGAAKDDDFYAWLLRQADALRNSRFPLLDRDGLAEELEAMAASEKRELKSRLIILMAHLLKWQWAEQRTLHQQSWRKTIREQRRQLSDFPTSLKKQIEPLLVELYEEARQDAIDDTGLDAFPTDCSWQTEELLSSSFWPSKPATSA
jgi:hypothetical protein